MASKDDITTMITTIDAFFGGKLSQNENTVSWWCDELESMSINNCYEVFRSLKKQAQSKNTKVYAPNLNQFLQRYKEIFGDNSVVRNKENELEDCTGCTRGKKTLIMAGEHPFYRPISIKTLSCNGDDAGTIYDQYIYVDTPCSCSYGLYVNDKMKYGYDLGKLNKIAESAFTTQQEAIDFCDENVYKLKAEQTNNLDELVTLYEEINKNVKGKLKNFFTQQKQQLKESAQ